MVNQLGLQKASYIREDFYTNDDLDSDESTGDSATDIDLANYYGVIGNFEVCTVLWNPVIGNYEVQQVDETYHGNAKIFITKGMIEVKNKFVMKNKFNYANRLKINTPFVNFKSIASNFKLKIPEEKGFTARFDVGALNGPQWKNYGFKLNYELPKHPALRVHDVSLIILYPVMNSSRININSRFEFEKNALRLATITLDGFETYLKMAGVVNVSKQNFNL